MDYRLTAQKNHAQFFGNTFDPTLTNMFRALKSDLLGNVKLINQIPIFDFQSQLVALFTGHFEQ